MKFNFDCEEALDCDQNGIAILEGSYQNKIVPGYRLYVKEILDTMGELSSKSQNLQTIITNTNRFFPSNHRLFIKAEKNIVYGYIKIGPKNLFLRDRYFNYHERKTLCVLDFYVYDNVQRKGIGKQLFDYMLNLENTEADLLAYDRPTSRLLAFLKKNYGLENYITQNNSFIIFDNFFAPKSIPRNDTEFDNYTYRVIQNLNTPQYLNTNNYEQNNYKRYLNRNNFASRSSPRINVNQNKYYDNYNYNNESDIRNNNNYMNPKLYNNRNNNKINNDNSHPRAMSPIGNQLIYSNDFTNKVVNKDVYKQPNLGFQKYYLNKEDSLAYDNIYSKKKMNLINDYMASKHQTPYEYVEEQNNRNGNNINNSNQRQNVLNNKISDIKYNNRYKDDELYNKRYNYATLFDDKKIAEHEYIQQNKKFNRSQDFINEKEYQDFQMNRRKSPRYENNYQNEIPRSPQVYRNNYNNNNSQNDDEYYIEKKTEYTENYNLDNYYDNDERQQSLNKKYY